MANGIAQVHARIEKKKVTIIGMGRTPRGQRFIKESIPLSCSSMHDKNFKQEMANAVDKLLAEQLALPL